MTEKLGNRPPKLNDGLAIGPAPHRSPGPLGPENPGRVQKESRKSTPGRAPKVPKECAPELQFRRARTGHKNPPRPEIRKKYEKITKSPTLGWAPKIRKNYRKNTKRSFSGPFCIFSVIFSYFRGPTQGGGFCNFFVFFSYFRPWGVFVPCTSPTELQPQSLKRVRRVQKSGFRLFSDSFETPGRTLSGLLGPCTGVLFRDAFRPGFSGPKGPGDPVWGGANCNDGPKRRHTRHT